MREIIFRGKSFNENVWVYGMLYGYYYEQKIAKSHFIHTGTEHFYIRDEETIGQYTGMKDKTGKRIFEGDIITVPWSTHRWLVKFCDGQFLGVNEKKLRSKLHSTEIFADIIVGYTSGVEVIGNIHDNPELLR